MPSEMLRILARAAIRNVEFCNFDKQSSKDAKAIALVKRYKELSASGIGTQHFEIDALYAAVITDGYEALKRNG